MSHTQCTNLKKVYFSKETDYPNNQSFGNQFPCAASGKFYSH